MTGGVEQRDGAVVVTGATGIIGCQIVSGLVASGHTVVAVARRASAAEWPAGARVKPLDVDLAVEGGAQHTVEMLRGLGEAPVGLVHGARSLENLAPGGSGWPDDSQWRSEFDLAVVRGAQLGVGLAQAFPTSLRSVILVGSIYGVVAPNLRLYEDPPRQSPIHYGVVRAAVVQLGRELAVRLAPHVRVNVVSYGGVRGRASPEFEERYGALSPSGRMLDPTELSGAVEFLLSDRASGITGHNLMVDGGWVAW